MNAQISAKAIEERKKLRKHVEAVGTPSNDLQWIGFERNKMAWYGLAPVKDRQGPGHSDNTANSV